MIVNQLKKTNNISLSIITVCLNASKTISRNVISIKKFCENYPNSEHIIIDGNSTDETIRIIKNLQHRNLNWQSENDKGVYHAMNKGLDIANKNYVLFINADDFLCDAGKLIKTLELFMQNSHVDLIFSDIDIVNKHGKTIRAYHTSKWFKHWMFSIGIAPPHPGTIYKRELIEKMNKFNASFKITGDFDLALRMASLKNYKMSDNVFTKMQEGGISTRGLKSYTKSTIEISRSLRSNNYHSWFLSPLRLPIKYFYSQDKD